MMRLCLRALSLLHEEKVHVFKIAFQLVDETRRLRAVRDSVVKRQRQGHDFSYDDFAANDNGLLAYRSYGENRAFWRVCYWRGENAAYRADVRYCKRASLRLRTVKAPALHLLRQIVYLSRHVHYAFRLRPLDVRHYEPVPRIHGYPDVVIFFLYYLFFFHRGVHVGVILQRFNDGANDERQKRELYPFLLRSCFLLLSVRHQVCHI